ncbi:MAG: S49 family peptidase, partial [Rhodospirillaceae bacterium]|nr:S49 family peptidase [Rhodospirillaceae bacterium]
MKLMTSSQPLLIRLCGRPLAIAPRRLEALLRTVVSPDAAGTPGDFAQAAPPSPTVAAEGIAVVPVVGPLVSRGDWLTALLGAVSYAEVGDAVEAALADPAARAVLLELDSPGGEVGGLFDLIERLAALRANAGKPLWAVGGGARPRRPRGARQRT